MKRYIWILICFLSISTYAATEERKEKFTAALPDGTTIELVGLRCFDKRDLEKFKDRDVPWWRPDGLSLRRPPNSWRGGGIGGDSHLFVIRVTGDASSDCRAVGPWATVLSVQPVKRRAQGFEQDDLRQFTLRFASNQKQANIKLGLATDDWKVADRWDRWSIGPRFTPYNEVLCSSDQLILRCPEQVGSDVVAEVTQVITERATRLVLFDKDGNRHESKGEIGGEGVGLVRHIHRFKNLDRSSIEHIEFQARPYEYWITLDNVSLHPGHETNVEIKVEKISSLLGKSMPVMSDLGIKQSDANDKAMLVCFWDMNQRPSRNCIMRLAKQAEQLKQKGVSVVVVQVSKVDENRLNEWVKKNNFPFPIGMNKGDEEEIRFTWGVRSLPWLILTDTNQIVRAEGFGMQNLDAKLKQISGD